MLLPEHDRSQLVAALPGIAANNLLDCEPAQRDRFRQSLELFATLLRRLHPVSHLKPQTISMRMVSTPEFAHKQCWWPQTMRKHTR
jgi:hypothetical protein